MLAGMADRFGDAPAPRAPARPRHDGRAARGQAPRRRGQARARLPDPLGRQDLLGARQGRAEAAAGQDRGAAGQGRRPRRRPRAQGAAGRAGGGHARDHPLFGGRPRGQQGSLGVAEARHRAPAPAARPHGADRQPHRRRQQVRRRQEHARRADRGQAAPARPPPRAAAPITGGKIDVTAPLPEHMRKTWELAGPGRGALREGRDE